MRPRPRFGTGCSLGRPFSTATPRLLPETDFTHAVIGGGVVGLAVARQLARRPGTTTVLLERHPAVGTETSSRNSEVIHAGLYYPPDSLKTRLCIAGRRLLYAFCTENGVRFARTGKWIVAQTAHQRAELERLHVKVAAHRLDVPLRWVGQLEARREEPHVRALHGVLESAETGIVDSHGLMACLQAHFEEAGGVVALGSEVVGAAVAAAAAGSCWRLDVCSAADGQQSAITVGTVVNAAGLGAAAVYNLLEDDPARRVPMYYAKGRYYSYSAPRPRTRRLIYPTPEPGHAGLGTHLTLDLAGRVRFGPDVSWVESAGDLDAGTTAPSLAAAVAEIRSYLPDVDATAITPDYAGIRPKLRPAGGGFQDFVVEPRPGRRGWLDLLGIESPGLTSCLAIAELVDAKTAEV